eukprot:m.157339 g.157339  ORF g.157339 m.157339 type:complete len:1076 (+) comp10227_c0_seq1:138-3365(+)
MGDDSSDDERDGGYIQFSPSTPKAGRRSSKWEQHSSPQSPQSPQSTQSPQSLRSILKSPSAISIASPPPDADQPVVSLRKQVSWDLVVRQAGGSGPVLVTDATDCVRGMAEGALLIKLRGKAREYLRTFMYDEKAQAICWRSARGKHPMRFLAIHSISEVRRGKRTKMFTYPRGKEFPAPHCFSIIYGDRYRTLDFVADSEVTCDIWVTGLKHLIKQSANNGSDREAWLRTLFLETCHSDNELSFHDLQALLRRLHVPIDEDVLQIKLMESLEAKRGPTNIIGLDPTHVRVSVEEFLLLYRTISTRQELFFLLSKYSSDGSPVLTAAEFRLFLELEQGVIGLSEDECASLITQYEPSSRQAQHMIGIDGFTNYLLAEGSIFKKEHATVYQDMMQPFNNYYIASSHNTYLLGDQLRSESSPEAYHRVLKQGCRCVEVDCWDGPDGSPIVYHGYTATSRIPFASVIEAIAASAFVTSEYPVIISLEVHCSIKQQMLMVQSLRHYLGDHLFVPAAEFVGNLPSPFELRKRVLLKGPKIPDEKLEEDEVYEEDEASIHDKSSKTDQRKSRTGRRPPEPKPKGPRNIKISRDLSVLISIPSTKFSSLDEHNEVPPAHCFSIMESKFEKLCETSAISIPTFASKHMIRNYPDGARVNSANYEIQDAWCMGVQMVALNYQTPDEPLQLNIARFRQNGSCGYILKPPFLTDPARLATFNPYASIFPETAPRRMIITIISGQHLSSNVESEIVDPYVAVAIVGASCDRHLDVTRAIKNNGFNPYWNETFEFKIMVPELAMLRISVLDDDFIRDDFLAQYSCPIQSISTGYRHIPLDNQHGTRLPHSSLFVKVAFSDKLGDDACEKAQEKKRRDSRRDSRRSSKIISKLKPVGLAKVDNLFKEAQELAMEIDKAGAKAHRTTREFEKHMGANKGHFGTAVEELFKQIHAASGEIPRLESLGLAFRVVVSKPADLPGRLFHALELLEHMSSAWSDVLRLKSQVDVPLSRSLQSLRELELHVQNDMTEASTSHKDALKAVAAFTRNMKGLSTYPTQMNEIISNAERQMLATKETAALVFRQAMQIDE